MWVWQELFTSVPLPRPLMVERFYRLVSQEMPSLKAPGGLAAVAAMQSKEKSKLVGHAM